MSSRSKSTANWVTVNRHETGAGIPYQIGKRKWNHEQCTQKNTGLIVSGIDGIKLMVLQVGRVANGWRYLAGCWKARCWFDRMPCHVILCTHSISLQLKLIRSFSVLIRLLKVFAQSQTHVPRRLAVKSLLFRSFLYILTTSELC
jgi:hypothetical protein